MAPSPTAFDLRWRLFGIHFRVQPMFWIVNLLFGWMYLLYGHGDAAHDHFRRASDHPFRYLALWAACAFFAILVHELGHVIMGRVFGVSSNIILCSLGGMAIGEFGRLKSWQRILVSLAGPAAGLTLCLLAWRSAVPALINRFDGLFLINHAWVGDTLFFLFIMCLFWNLFNLIPIVPLDGGMVMLEVVSFIFPRQGMRLAYGFSFLVAGAVVIYSLMHWYRPALPYPPLDPLFNAMMFGLMAMNSFSTLNALRPEAEAKPKRWAEYEERDW